MMDPNLIISDEYVMSIGKACAKRGRALEDILDSYLSILREIGNEAVLAGEISVTLQEYIGCVAALNNQLKEISNNMNSACENFIENINDADSFLF